MAIECTMRALGFAVRIDMKDDASRFFPIGALGLGIEKPPIRHQMLLIVGRQHCLVGRDISYT